MNTKVSTIQYMCRLNVEQSWKNSTPTSNCCYRIILNACFRLFHLQIFSFGNTKEHWGTLRYAEECWGTLRNAEEYQCHLLMKVRITCSCSAAVLDHAGRLAISSASVLHYGQFEWFLSKNSRLNVDFRLHKFNLILKIQSHGKS